MKLKIKLKLFDKDCMPEVHGDRIDLKSAQGFAMCDKRITTVNLGVAMQLPPGYEAVITPRSGTFKKYSMLLVNSVGVIDNTYCGNEDIWKAQFICIQEKKEWEDKKYDDTEYNKKWRKTEYGEFVDTQDLCNSVYSFRSTLQCGRKSRTCSILVSSSRLLTTSRTPTEAVLVTLVYESTRSHNKRTFWTRNCIKRDNLKVFGVKENAS